MPLIIGAKSASASTGVANSCRFNEPDSAYLYRTSTGSDNTGTLSMWVKRGTLGTTQYLMHVQNATDNTDYGVLNFTPDDTIELMMATNGLGQMQIITNRVFRDPSAWYHFVFVIDPDNATANYRMRMYVNGVEETSFATDDRTGTGVTNWFFQPSDTNKFCLAGNVAGAHTISGYISQIACCIGTAYTPSDFGEFDEDSPTIWKPKDFSGDVTFGSEGFYLDFADSADLGADVSGNSTDFTEGSLDAIDQCGDTPTNNFCVMNPLVNTTDEAAVYSQGNTVVVTDGTSGDWGFTGTFAMTTGKWYYEHRIYEAKDFLVGIHSDPAYLASGSYESISTKYVYAWRANGTLRETADDGTLAYISYGSTFTTGDILSIYLDLDANKLYFAKNDVMQESGTGIDVSDVSLTQHGEYYWCQTDAHSGQTWTITPAFGGVPSYGTTAIASAVADAEGYGQFEYDPSRGGASDFDGSAKNFLSLCTKNLAAFGG